MLIDFKTRDKLTSHHGAALLEGARSYAVNIMPLSTKKQQNAYLFAMESFQSAFWQIIREEPWFINRSKNVRN